MVAKDVGRIVAPLAFAAQIVPLEVELVGHWVVRQFSQSVLRCQLLESNRVQLMALLAIRD